MSVSAVSVLVSGSLEAALVGGPVSAILTVSNPTTLAVLMVLPYPNPNNLTFRVSKGYARPKVVERDETERSAPISIAAGGSHTVTYYLNRQFSFTHPGELTIAYHLDTSVSVGGGTYDAATFEGEFTITLASATESRLRDELDRTAKDLRSSDRSTKMAAAEALAFLEGPATVEYLVPMLSIDDLEIIGIRALGRHAKEQAEQHLLAMLSHPDSAVVKSALVEMRRIGVVVPRQGVRSLLLSGNANVRWVALEWLSARPSSEDLPVVSPLLRDENSGVREKALSYVKELERK